MNYSIVFPYSIVENELTKRLVLLGLIVSMQIAFAGRTFATTKEERNLAKIKSGVAKLGTGPAAQVEIKLKNGSKVRGHVTSVEEQQFVVMEKASGQTVPVAYSQVKQVKGNNLNTGVKNAIGFGVFILVMFLLLLSDDS